MQKKSNKSNWKALKLWPLVTIALVLLTCKNLVSVALAKSEAGSITIDSPSKYITDLWTIHLFSKNSLGVQGNDSSLKPSISDDGKLVAFVSYADNLIPNDTNQTWDAFVKNVSTGEITLVSKNTDGHQASASTDSVAISGNGRYVAFASSASDLVAGDSDWSEDVFIYDMVTGITTLVSQSTAGVHGNGDSLNPSISDDGRYVTFESLSSNLVNDHTYTGCQVYLRDRLLGTTSIISTNTNGEPAAMGASGPTISGDGRYIVFDSYSGNLVEGDMNGHRDIFLHNNQTGSITRVSVNSQNQQGNGESSFATLNDDGRFIVFLSFANNLVFGDTNNDQDVYVHDMQTGETSMVSVSSSGVHGNGRPIYQAIPVISDNGRYTVFNSSSTNLIDGTEVWGGTFIRDLLEGTTKNIISQIGLNNPSMSSNALNIAFDFDGEILDPPHDTNKAQDVFLISSTGGYSLSTELSGTGTGWVIFDPSGIVCIMTCSYYFPESTIVSFTATPTAGSHFAGWSGDVSSLDNPFDMTMDADKSITATFDLDEYTLAIISDHGTVTKSPNKPTYHYGDTVQLTSVPNSTYSFAYWSGAGSGSPNQILITIQGNTTITAHYLQNAHLLNITSDHGIVSKSPDQAVYMDGDVVQITASPNLGAQFDHWSGAISSPANPVNVTINGDTSVTANYVLDEYTLTIKSDHGTVMRAPDKPTYHYGDVIQLTAAPDFDYSFTGWSGAETSAANPFDFTIHGNTNLTANFSLNTYTLTVVKTGHGGGRVTSSPSGIDCGSDCSQIYSAGTNVTLTAATITPLTTFTGWTGGGCTGVDTCTLELHSDITIRADFLAYRLYIPLVSKPIPPPGPFAKSNPVNGAVDQPRNPTLTWTASEGATQYEYCIDTINNSSCDTGWVNTNGHVYIQLSGLASSTPYYWQVRANKGGMDTLADNGIWWSFTTRWGPKPGFWWDNTTGTYFFVTPDQAIVREFSIYVYIEDCYDGWVSRTYPAGDVNISSDNTFSFSGPLYASGTFDLETTAHGQMGLSHFGPLCGYYWSGGPFSWNAVWLDSTQPTASELRALEANVRHVLRGTNPPIFFTPDKK
jgi:hypothetical protein